MKRMKMLVKTMGVCTVITMMSLTLGGCSKSDTKTVETTKGSEGKSEKDASDKIKVSVGIGNIFVPFCYLDDGENPAGYDYEVVCAVAEKLEDKYEFTINPDDFSNLLIGLDTKKYDMAVHHFGYTDERAENYLYAEEADMYFGSFHVGYLKGRTGITDLESCKGLTAVTTNGTMAETILLNWNKENPDSSLKVEYATDLSVIATGIKNGLYDVFIESEYDLNLFNSKYDNVLAYSDYNITPEGYNDGAYFIYQKGAEELQQDVDTAIRELREEGILKGISEEILGKDYSKK